MTFIRATDVRAGLVTALLVVLTACCMAPSAAGADNSRLAQLQACLKAKHFKLPPTDAELKSKKFAAGLQVCMDKVGFPHLVTAQGVINFITCLRNHGVEFGTTPVGSAKFKKAAQACRPELFG